MHGYGCKECNNKNGSDKRIRKILENGGSLADKNPELLSEWDYQKNTIYPYEVTASSTQTKVYWLCDKGHSYLMSPANRTNGKQGCPYCSGKRVLIGFNDLKSNSPDIIQYWDYEKNYPLTPEDVMKRSSKKVWWICPDCGESYQMSIHARIVYKWNVCLSCSKKRSSETRVKNLISGGDSLALLEPELATEWHPSRNGSLTPEDVTRASSKEVWWLCSKCGNEYKMGIHLRTKGEGCPKCAIAYKTSEPEQMIFFYMNKFFPDTVNSYKNNAIGKQEIDIYIPSLSLGIEYDGSRWHQNIEKDEKKTKLLKDNSIELIRIREKGCPDLNDSIIH